MNILQAKQNKDFFNTSKEQEISELFAQKYNASTEAIRKFIFEDGKIEFMFNFKTGGWNTVYASSLEEAIEMAKKEYNGETLQVNENSFSIPTKSSYDAALRSFY